MLDPLTHIVQSLGLVGGVFLEGEFTAPWAITAHVTEEDCKPFMPIPKQVIAYHVVTEGELLLAANNHEHLAKAGDVIIFPANSEHLLASDASVPAILGDDLLLPAGESGLVRIQHGHLDTLRPPCANHAVGHRHRTCLHECHFMSARCDKCFQVAGVGANHGIDCRKMRHLARIGAHGPLRCAEFRMC